jgi:hypothetical protein
VTYKKLNLLMDERTDGWTNVWMNKWTDGWTDKRTDLDKRINWKISYRMTMFVVIVTKVRLNFRSFSFVYKVELLAFQY